MSILMRVRLVFCGVAMKIPPAKIRHMKMPHNSMQMWNMALTGIIPLSLSESLSLSLSLRRCLRRKPAYLFRVS